MTDLKKIIECVPNFSEGRDREKIKEITDEIEKVEGVKLLDFEPDESHNRTVVTFVGEPQRVLEAAFRAIAKAAEVIDMRKHKGEHPRMGATDVCPFVPVQNVSMDECVELAKELGKRVARELNIPIYLYEEAAAKPERKNLALVRKGEYEGLPEKLKDPNWQPDFGQAVFNPKSGTTVIGAREFLVAYNVNLDTEDLSLAKKIAGEIRESGVKKILEDETVTRIPGLFKCVKALPVDLKDITQVSINLTNYKVTNMDKVYETIKEKAKEAGVEVIGSEIIGVLPKQALVISGKVYLPEETSEEKLIQIAVENLCLDKIQRFVLEEKVIEYMI